MVTASSLLLPLQLTLLPGASLLTCPWTASQNLLDSAKHPCPHIPLIRHSHAHTLLKAFDLQCPFIFQKDSFSHFHLFLSLTLLQSCHWEAPCQLLRDFGSSSLSSSLRQGSEGLELQGDVFLHCAVYWEQCSDPILIRFSPSPTCSEDR